MIEGFAPERRTVDTLVMGCAGAVCGTEIGVLVVERLEEDGEAESSVEVIWVAGLPEGTRLSSAVTAPALTATPTASISIWSFMNWSLLQSCEIFL